MDTTFKTTNSFLSARAKVPTIMDEVEAVNVSHNSKDELGARLSPLFAKPFQTVFGTVGCIKNYMDFLTKDNYPLDLLPKPRLRSVDVRRIPKGTKRIPNYWAVIAYGLTQRILQDTELQLAIAKNTLPYTSYSSKTEATFFNSKVTVTAPDQKMGKYLAILRYIESAIKANKFNSELANEIIIRSITNPEFDVFAGTTMEKKFKAETLK